MDASDKSKFLFMSGSALASRRIIEESSYATTPDQSSADPTPPCGEAVYRKKPLDTENLKTVDMILKMGQARDGETLRPPSKKTSTIGSSEKSTDKESIGKDETDESKKSTGKELEIPKLSIMFKLLENLKLIRYHRSWSPKILRDAFFWHGRF